MVGCEERVIDGAATPGAAPADSPTADRVSLEIKGAQLNAALQNALRRKRSLQVVSPEQGSEREENSVRSHEADGDGVRGRRSGHTDRLTGSAGGGSSSSRDTDGSPKEAALLKAAMESLRAGLREKEDAVTELEREREGLLEKVASLESATQDNVKLAQKMARLEGQTEGLEAKLTQADNERSLTKNLVDTLKSVQNDLRTSHAQVSQRYAELENTAEDSADAVRRGNILLHSQQLKIDAQSRQVKRQEEDLVSLRQERELQLTKADEHAAQLIQVLRRERAGQASIADARAEVDELKGELGHMREAFGRHRNVLRKNQGVIDAHEKALRDVRSELLSVSLEAEKQSARHLQASAHAASEMARVTAERNGAVRESGALRIENEDLKDKLEEVGRKLDEVQNTESAATAAVAATEAGPRNTAQLRGKHHDSNLHPQHPHHHHHQQQQHANHDGPPQVPAIATVAAVDGSLSSPFSRPYGGDILLTTGTGVSSSERAGPNETPPSSSPGTAGFVRQDPPTSSSTSAADAGGGGGGGRGEIDSGGGGTGGGAGRGANALGSRKNPRTAAAPPEDHGSNNGRSVDRAAASETASSRRPRQRPSPSNTGADEETSVDDAGGSVTTPVRFSSPPSPSEGTRKRAKTAAATAFGNGDAAGAAGDVPGIPAADGVGGRGAAGCLSSARLPGPGAAHRRASSTVGGSGPREDAVRHGDDGSPDDAGAYPDAVCPSCGDTPYGLMINCSGCYRQHHSSCVPDGQRVGKGLGVVFHCSKCTNRHG